MVLGGEVIHQDKSAPGCLCESLWPPGPWGLRTRLASPPATERRLHFTVTILFSQWK